MRSAAFSRIAPPSELACSWLNWANSGLSNRSGNRTVCGTVSVVTQGPPWWRKWLLTLHLYHTGALVSCTGIGTRHEFSGLEYCSRPITILDPEGGNLVPHEETAEGPKRWKRRRARQRQETPVNKGTTKASDALA